MYHDVEKWKTVLGDALATVRLQSLLLAIEYSIRCLDVGESDVTDHGSRELRFGAQLNISAVEAATLLRAKAVKVAPYAKAMEKSDLHGHVSFSASAPRILWAGHFLVTDQ